MTNPVRLKPPHPAQQNIIKDNSDNVIVAASRRFGKSYVALMGVLETCLDFDNWIAWRGNPGYQIDVLSPAKVLVLTPTRSMAKRLYWQPLMELIKSQPAVARLVENINATELCVTWKGNRPALMVGGASHDDGNVWRGTKIIKAVCDEVADIPWSSINESIKPALADTLGSQFIAIGSTKGRGNNSLWKLYELSLKLPKLYSFHRYTALDNPFFRLEAIRAEAMVKSPAVFEREYMASWANYNGKIFPYLTKDNLIDIKDAPKSYETVISGVDFGARNQAASVLGLSNGCWYILESYQNLTGEVMDSNTFYQAIAKLCRKYYVEGVYADPSRPDSILDMRQVGVQENAIGMSKTVEGYNPIAPGLDQVSNLIYRKELKIVHDSNTPAPNQVSGERLYTLMEAYRYEQDAEENVLEKVLDGQDDHAIDSIRMALAMKNPGDMRRRVDKSKGLLKPKVAKIDPRLDPDSPHFDPKIVLAARTRGSKLPAGRY